MLAGKRSESSAWVKIDGPIQSMITSLPLQAAGSGFCLRGPDGCINSIGRRCVLAGVKLLAHRVSHGPLPDAGGLKQTKRHHKEPQRDI